MENLILIIGDKTYQFNNINEIYSNILGKKNQDYSLLSEKEKSDRRYELAYINTNCNEDLVGTLYDTLEQDIPKSKKIFIDSDETYLFSLLKENIITLLMKKDYNVFQDAIDKGNFKDSEDNYIILNNFANDFLIKEKNKILNKEQTEKQSIKLLPDFSDDTPVSKEKLIDEI